MIGYNDDDRHDEQHEAAESETEERAERRAHALVQIKRIQGVWMKEAAARTQAARMIALAGGDTISYIRPMPHEPIDHHNRKPKFAPNFLGLALKMLSYLYDEEPARKMLDGEDEQEWASRALWDFGIGLSASIGYADPFVRLTGAALLFLSHKASEDAARDLRSWMLGGEAPVYGDEDGIEASLVTRDRFAVLCNELDPRYMEAVLVQMASRAASHGLTKHRFHYWDDRYFAILEWDGTTPSMTLVRHDGEELHEHGLGAIPFAVLRDSEATTGFYPTQTWGGDDLFCNIRTVAELFSEYGYNAKLQRGQPWIKGEAKNKVLAPDAFIQLEPDGAFGVEPLKADLEGMRRAVWAMLDSLGKTLGLPSSTFKIEQREGMSGIAIALERAELSDDRKAREKTARIWERRIHRLAATIYNAVRGTDYAGNVAVQFRPFITPLTFGERIKRLEFELANGLTSKLDALLELHPDLSEDEAREQLARASGDAQEAQRARVEERTAEATAAAQAQAAASPLAALLGGQA